MDVRYMAKKALVRVTKANSKNKRHTKFYIPNTRNKMGIKTKTKKIKSKRSQGIYKKIVRILKGIKLFILPFAIYLYSIMPNIEIGRSIKIFDKKYFAHRGLHDSYVGCPENSLSAFARAKEAGYGIELDVRLSSDGIPVIYHDDDIYRMTGEMGSIENMLLSRIKELKLLATNEQVPTLRDVIELIDGKVPLIIEIKMDRINRDICLKVNEVLGFYKGDYVIESFHPYALLWYRTHRPDVIRGQLSTNLRLDGGNKSLSHLLISNIMMNWIGKPDFIAYSHEYKNNISLNICKKLYRPVMVAWTIRNIDELEANRNDYDAFIFEGFRP